MRECVHRDECALVYVSVCVCNWVSQKRTITQTIVDIYKFITDQYCPVEEQFFYTGSKLAREEKFEKLRSWRTNDLDMNDYKLPDIF